MTIPTSLSLIAAGAILKFAVTLHLGGINLRHAGVILMIAGGVGIVIWLVATLRPGSVRTPPPDAM